jgi:hypothetical protein
LLRAALVTLALALPSLACAQPPMPKVDPSPSADVAPLPHEPVVVTAFSVDAPKPPPPQSTIVTDVRRARTERDAQRFAPGGRWALSDGVRFTGSGLAFLRRF